MTRVRGRRLFIFILCHLILSVPARAQDLALVFAGACESSSDRGSNDSRVFAGAGAAVKSLEGEGWEVHAFFGGERSRRLSGGDARCSGGARDARCCIPDSDPACVKGWNPSCCANNIRSAMDDFLKQSGLPESRVGAFSLPNVLNEVRGASKSLRANDRLLLFFFTHGNQGGLCDSAEGNFNYYDLDANYPKLDPEQTDPGSILHRAFKAASSKGVRIGIDIDACYSGNGVLNWAPYGCVVSAAGKDSAGWGIPEIPDLARVLAANPHASLDDLFLAHTYSVAANLDEPLISGFLTTYTRVNDRSIGFTDYYTPNSFMSSFLLKAQSATQHPTQVFDAPAVFRSSKDGQGNPLDEVLARLADDMSSELSRPLPGDVSSQSAWRAAAEGCIGSFPAGRCDSSPTSASIAALKQKILDAISKLSVTRADLDRAASEKDAAAQAVAAIGMDSSILRSPAASDSAWLLDQLKRVAAFKGVSNDPKVSSAIGALAALVARDSDAHGAYQALMVLLKQDLASQFALARLHQFIRARAQSSSLCSSFRLDRS